MQQIRNFCSRSTVDSNIFSDFQKKTSFNAPLVNNSYSKTPVTDELQITQSTAKKRLINKKTLIGAAAIAAGAVAAIIIGKNVQKTLSVMKSQTNHTQQGIESAKKALIGDNGAGFNTNMNGICFYGPDCEAKEKTIKEFVGELKNAGYEIKHTPRASEADNKTIGSVLENFITGAKELFQNENKKTAIVVRDLDKIAPDGTKEFSPVTGILKKYTEHAQEQGFTVVSEAVDIKNVDSAVRRIGRIDEKLLVQPLASDSIEAHKKYAELLAYHCNKQK